MPKFQIEATRLTLPVVIHTSKGDMIVNPGDWLITGANGEQFSCKDEIFRKIYEPVEDEEQNNG